MKIRQGFVSNSSSSSFIIPINNIPSSVEELQQKMYGDASEIEYMYDWRNERTMLDTRTLAEIVYRDMTEKAQIPMDELLKSIEEDWWEGEATVDAVKQMMKTPNKKIIVLSYSDNDGKYFTQLEHSGIIESTFKGTVRVSQH
jgi:hypothetical protein